MKKYENFCKALANLNEGAELEAPYTVVEKTGIVALFGICFEQAWKLMKEVLEEHGRFEEKIGLPKAIIKIAYQCGMIHNCEGWLELLESRNLLAHTYNEEQALSVIKKIKSDYFALFAELKMELEEKWL